MTTANVRGIIPAADDFPSEVVTRAIVRDVDLGPGAGVLALITLDNGHDHTKPNTFGPQGLLSLNAALDAAEARAAAGEIAAVGVTGKPFILAAGADLDGAAAAIAGAGLDPAAARERALGIASLGHAVFRRLGELPVPSFAFINGVALGGGLEVALHCTYRTISAGVPMVAFPECFLGLVPGWGGAYLLPRLIGPARALKLIIENPLSQNKMLRGPEAFELGIADAMFEPADFLEESLRWAARVLTGAETVSRAADALGLDGRAAGTEEEWAQAVAGARFFVDGKLHGAAPAPYRALDLVAAARTASRDEGFAAEDDALADLMLSEELRAGLYAFDLVQKRAKRPAGAPDKSLARPVTKVGVVGAGLMAAQIALLFVRRLQVPVVMTDLDQARVDSGVGYVRAEIDKQLSRGRISPDAANRQKALITGSVAKDGFADADFVIEAVFEELAVKRQVLAEVEAVVPETCVLATNTSSLSVTAMASGLAHPERVVGFHFFNPVAVLPLVEVVRGSLTDDAAVATALAVGTAAQEELRDRRGPSRVRGQPGAHPVPRRDHQHRRRGHAVRGRRARRRPARPADDAVPAAPARRAEDRAARGGDPARRVRRPVRRLAEAAGPGRVGQVLGVPAGLLGRPRGHRAAQRRCGADPAPSTGPEVLERALEGLAEEIRIMLDEGVVAAPEDIDLCMILGAGWPFHLGGITPYLDRTGIAAKVNGVPFRG